MTHDAQAKLDKSVSRPARYTLDARAVQELVRHESVTSTQMYTRVTADERREAVARLVT